MTKSKGLGDDIAKFTKATGIKKLVDKLRKVINSKKPTKLNLHIGPAQIGVIRKIITIIIFNLLSIILSQLLLP